MDEYDKRKITRNLIVVKERVGGDLDHIVDRLIEEDIFTIQIKEEIDNALPATPQNKTTLFVNNLLRGRKQSYEIFKQILLERGGYEDLVNKMDNTRSDSKGASGETDERIKTCINPAQVDETDDDALVRKTIASAELECMLTNIVASKVEEKRSQIEANLREEFEERLETNRKEHEEKKSQIEAAQRKEKDEKLETNRKKHEKKESQKEPALRKEFEEKLETNRKEQEEKGTQKEAALKKDFELLKEEYSKHAKNFENNAHLKEIQKALRQRINNQHKRMVEQKQENILLKEEVRKLEDLTKENENLKDENEKLKKENTKLKHVMKELEKRIMDQEHEMNDFKKNIEKQYCQLQSELRNATIRFENEQTMLQEDLERNSILLMEINNGITAPTKTKNQTREPNSRKKPWIPGTSASKASYSRLLGYKAAKQK